MNVLHNRIESYSNSSIQWPYLKKRYLQPDNLAKAGFYFMHKSDQVRCYLCEVELSQWKHNQSPFIRHSNESPTCPLVLLQFPERSSRMNRNKAAAQPFDATRRNARLATFDKYWPPHKRRKRIYPAVTKLADTGFYYSPTPEEIARIVCPYCKISIPEPDKSMDFLGRHREDCIFLVDTPDEIKGPTTTHRRGTADSASSVDTYKTAASGSSLGSQGSNAGQKRKRTAAEDSSSLTRSKLRKLDDENAQIDEDNSSIWDFGKVLSLPTSVRKPTFTFGAKKSRRPQHHNRQVGSAKDAGTVDILAGLKIGKNTQRRQSSISSSNTAPLSFIVKPQSMPVLQTMESILGTKSKETTRATSPTDNNDDSRKIKSTGTVEAQLQPQPLATSPSSTTSKMTTQIQEELTEETSPNTTSNHPTCTPKVILIDGDSTLLENDIVPLSPPFKRKDKGKARADGPRLSLPSSSTSTATAKGKAPLRLSSQPTSLAKRPSINLSKTKTLEQRRQQQSQETFYQTLPVHEERLYLQSTPQRGNGVVHAHTIFGDDLPFSPIRGSSAGTHSSTATTAAGAAAATPNRLNTTAATLNTPLLYTPMLGQGRSRTIGQETPSRPSPRPAAPPSTVPYTPSRLAHQQSISATSSASLLSPTSTAEGEGLRREKEKQQLVNRPNLPSVDDIPPPDVSNLVLTLSDKEKKMTVEEFIQSIVDDSVQKVKERGKELAREIKDRSDKIKAQLLKQKEQLGEVEDKGAKDVITTTANG